MASTYLTRTFGTASSRTKFTVSVWLKKSTINSSDNDEKHFFNGYNSSNDRFMIYMTSADQLKIRNVDNGTENVIYTSNAKYRCVNGWYHVVVRIDSSQASGDRIRAYVNGEQITSWSSSTEPNQNGDFALGNNAFSNIIGSYAGTNHYWNGCMSHYHYCDGQSYAPTEFGETDSTTGEWKIKTSPSVTYGNQGFFLFKNDNSLTDRSGNGNNFTLSAGTLTKTEDNPSNVFATLNPLVYSSASKTYGHGNNSITASDSGNWCTTQTTLGASSGKYYCEIKINAVGSYHAIGVGSNEAISTSNVNSTQLIGEVTGSVGWRNNGDVWSSNSAGTNAGTYTTGDILMIAMDCTNNKVYFGKNGTWVNSGDPTSGSTGTGSSGNLTSDALNHFVICPRGGSTYCNFGNGYFGTTAVSSAGTNASGNGIFEYDVPTGYTALSTKGLNL